MTDDILKRLRAPELYTETSWQELLDLAADRIEELEGTIRQIVFDAIQSARAALDGKK